VPDIAESRSVPRAGAWREVVAVIADPQLARLNYGIFVLHAVLMALFIAVPFSLRDAGLALDEHWKVYLPVMAASFVLMLPAVMSQDRPHRLKRYFVGSLALLLLAYGSLPWLSGGILALGIFLLLFFTPFNILEALLPSLTSKLAP
jgi:hypothetical protein